MAGGTRGAITNVHGRQDGRLSQFPAEVTGIDVKVAEWVSGKVRLIDQTRLPHEEVYEELADYSQVAAAIREMKVRGAPAIGIAAAYGLALGAQGIAVQDRGEFMAQLEAVSQALVATRPTAVNLPWALERMMRAAWASDDVGGIKAALLAEAQRIDQENDEATASLSEHGSELIEDGFTVLTHCNTGALATAGYGTALGVIRKAHEQGKRVHVFVAETRPLLQGARLTAWELDRYGVPHTLIADTMTGHFLARRHIDCAIVGADRIAANGDVANKIGTYNIAVLCAASEVPFFVAAPTSTIDLSTASGDDIPIEERDPSEVTHCHGVAIAPEGTRAANPAFDVTPSSYISAIITETGITLRPYERGLRNAIEAVHKRRR